MSRYWGRTCHFALQVSAFDPKWTPSRFRLPCYRTGIMGTGLVGGPLDKPIPDIFSVC
jgi:hypothetical protein